jgi:hypothetical protein
LSSSRIWRLNYNQAVFVPLPPPHNNNCLTSHLDIPLLPLSGIFLVRTVAIVLSRKAPPVLREMQKRLTVHADSGAGGIYPAAS